jgi:hypothetical protein
MYFLTFLKIVATFFAPLVPSDEVLFGQRLDDPLLGVLEGLLGKGEASQLHLEIGSEIEVGRGQVR